MKIHIFIRNLKIIKINFTEKILLNLHKTKNLIMNNIIFHLNLKNNDIFIYILFYILLIKLPLIIDESFLLINSYNHKIE